MYRLQEDRLERWIAQARPKPLILRGARQVGKSTLIQSFAAKKKLNLYEVNLENHPEMDRVFKSMDLKTIIQSIEAICDRVFLPSNALVFFDEIQATPSALSALRLFFDNPKHYFPVVCAGSLLEFTLESYTRSMPVGRIEYLHMGPMCFEEFLIALGNQNLVKLLESFSIGDDIDAASHRKLSQLLRDFFAVGGMPEAVESYRKDESLKAVQPILQFILDTYREDFYKYARKVDQRILGLLGALFDFIPSNVGRKIKYSNISRDEKSQYVKSAIKLLSQARVCHLVHHSSCSGIPLKIQKNDKIFKALFLDIGLMNRQKGMDWISLNALDDVRLVNEGSIAEQFVGQQLLYDREGLSPPELFYWQREARSSSAELDYVMSSGDLIVPIEVKAGKSGTMKSLLLFAEEKNLDFCIRLDMNSPSKTVISGLSMAGELTLVSLPLYLAGQLPRLLEEYRVRSSYYQ